MRSFIASIFITFALCATANAQPSILVVHGGGWQGSQWLSNGYVMRDRYKDAYNVENIDYSSNGPTAFAQIVAAYDRLAANGPVCVMGESAGGHYALLLAQVRPVACVVGVAAPVTLDPSIASPALIAYAHAAFGYEDFGQWDPSLNGRSTTSPVLLAYGAQDPIVPPTNGAFYADRHPATVVIVPGGTEPFSHSQVDPAAAAAYYAQERAFVDSALRPAPVAPAQAQALPVAAPHAAVTSRTKHKCSRPRVHRAARKCA